MKILITRPKEQAETLAKIFAASGIESIIEPMQKVETSNISLDTDYLAKTTLILFTSQNAIKYFADKSDLRNVEVCVLGEESYKIALEYGFIQTVIVENNAENLLDYVEKNYDKNTSVIYHPTQNNKSIDAEKILTDKGFKIKSEIVYNTISVTEFSGSLQNEIKTGQISHILFYSKLTAKIFVNLVKEYDFEGYMKHIKAYCLSEGIKNELLALNFPKIFVASSSKALLKEVMNGL